MANSVSWYQEDTEAITYKEYKGRNLLDERHEHLRKLTPHMPGKMKKSFYFLSEIKHIL